MKNLPLIMLMFWVPLTSSAQQPAALKLFNAERQYDGKVLVTWTLSAGYTCQDISLQYAPDSINFYTIYQSPGLNGSTGSDKSYPFLDASASSAGPNYYRLDLGNCGMSKVITPSNVPYGTTGYYFEHMPIKTETLLHFRNSGGFQFEFSVFDLKGTLKRVLLTSSNLIFFEPDGLEQGIYFFTLISVNDFYRGKIVVVK